MTLVKYYFYWFGDQTVQAKSCSFRDQRQMFCSHLVQWSITNVMPLIVITIFKTQKHVSESVCLLLLWSLSCCMTQFQPIFNCWDSLTLEYFGIQMFHSMTPMCPGPLAVCADMLCLFFAKWGTVHYDHFGLLCPKDVVPEVCWFVQVQLCRLYRIIWSHTEKCFVVLVQIT